MKITLATLAERLEGFMSIKTIYRIQSQLPGYDVTTYPITVDDSAEAYCRDRVVVTGRPRTRVAKPLPVGFEFATHRVTLNVADEGAWKGLQAAYPRGTWRRARKSPDSLLFGFGDAFQGMTLGEWVDEQQGGKRAVRRRYTND